jgi:hypothetical protein
MSDVLIRGVPRRTLDQLDRIAAQRGLNRSQMLRNLIEREAGQEQSSVTPDDFVTFSHLASDLQDPDVMHKAWN